MAPSIARSLARPSVGAPPPSWPTLCFIGSVVGIGQIGADADCHAVRASPVWGGERESSVVGFPGFAVIEVDCFETRTVLPSVIFKFRWRVLSGA
jgi:hypothetical protein